MDGLEWVLNDPVSTTEVATVRLLDEDQLVSDVLAEVPIGPDTVVSGNYEFQFRAERSLSAGMQSFFHTSLGQAISGVICIILLLLLVGMLWTQRQHAPMASRERLTVGASDGFVPRVQSSEWVRRDCPD